MRRRDFFAVLGGGILVLLVDDSDAQEAGGGARRGTNEPAPTALSAWLHIGEDGRITVYTGKVEVGQNARTHLLRRWAGLCCIFSGRGSCWQPSMCSAAAG